MAEAVAGTRGCARRRGLAGLTLRSPESGSRDTEPGRTFAEGGRPPVMNIVVCMKQVPDTWSERTLRSTDSTLDRDAADANGGEVTILSMGPEKASESIRKALSMGADKAVHLLDDALHGSDALATSAALAAVLGRIGFDLVI